MKRIRSIGLAAALAVMTAAPVAQAEQAARNCVTTAEAEALFLFVAPDLLQRTGQLCAANLPSNAFLNRMPAGFIAKYRAESDGAWPLAKRAITKIQPETASMLQSDFAAPIASTMMVELIVQGVQASDCAAIDRAVTLMQPLPPANLAGLVALFAQVAVHDDRANANVAPLARLRLCPAGA